MLGFGNFNAQDCSGPTRRSFIKTAAAVPFTIGSTSQVLEAAQAAQKSGRVKSVILLWLWDGPSHVDTFDPKPDAPMEYRGLLVPYLLVLLGCTLLNCFPRWPLVVTSTPSSI